MIDCGDWSVAASWAIPADATSGVYVARVTRDDTGGASQFPFVVRNDASQSATVFQTSGETWEAYNDWGGESLYTGNPVGRAYKVSYNRPFNNRADQPQNYVFGEEYPMIRLLEQNGYDVTYVAGVDAERNPTAILNHKVYLSVGHDEYWSVARRAAVESARDHGVNLAFLSGNEVYWKTRWENITRRIARSSATRGRSAGPTL